MRSQLKKNKDFFYPHQYLNHGPMKPKARVLKVFKLDPGLKLEYWIIFYHNILDFCP